MRIRLFFLVFFCLCLLLCLRSTAQESPDDKTNTLELPTFSVLQKTESLELKIGEQEFTVKYPPILPNSEQLVAADGKVLVRNVDYQIDFYPGKITIVTPDAITDPYKLKITYRTLPFAIKEVYKRDLYGEQNPDSLRFPSAEESSVKERSDETNRFLTDNRQLTTDNYSPDNQTSQLEVSGSQTFGISAGSGRDITPNQELRVNVEGNVSENISILALLSDQDLPIQPEGTTENIQDIDQKLVRITHPNMRGTLGDFEGSLGASEFIFFPRALEGVQVEGDFKWGKFHLIPSAIPKGQSTSLVLRGEEGRSEYRLTVDGQYVIVKAGSEIVWLNGERMRRGENNDYVIREYGDPIVEFNSKHLITSNDTIRIDFEYIPEERAYQQNLYGLSSVFTLPGERISLGASYAVEADLNQPEQALIQLRDTDLEALRQNILDPEEDGRSLLTPPRKHTVWGVESRMNITEKAWIEGELAYSNLDKNTYSTVDRKEVSQAWKLIGYADWDFATWTDKQNRGSKPLLHTNFDIRAMDADFVPVGASSGNRSRSRYETQYAKEGFDDAFLFDSAGRSQIARDERAANFDIRLIPMDWLALNAGVGRSEEREPQPTRTVQEATDAIGGTEVPSTANATIRDNFNWGVNFNQRSGSGSILPTPSRRGQVPSPLPSRQTRMSPETRHSVTSEEGSEKAPSKGAQLLRKLPNFRWDDYRSSSRVESEDSARTQSQRKSRQEGNLSYPLGPFRIIGTLGRLESNEARNATLNRKRNRAIGRVDLVKFSWVSVNTSYELEEAYAKEPLLTVDDAPIGLSDWQRSTTARTWKVGLFSQQKSFLSGGVNLTANLARRMLKAHTDIGADTTTQLADINIQLTPLSRAIDIELTYELDKKLTSQRHEIYTNIHPHTGVLLQPGEGYYVKLDDLHYVEDPEEGTYIKIYQNVGDKPTTAVDAEFRIRFQPRQYFARRARARQQQQRRGEGTSPLQRDSLRPTPNGRQSSVISRQLRDGSVEPESSLTDNRKLVTVNYLEWLLSALRGQIRFWLTEEQEVEDAVSLYLLQSLQGSDTLFGRLNQHHRLEFSPSPAFSLEFNLRTGETLNKRINNQERHRLHNTWDVGFSVNPTKRLSVGANWEQRRENEKYSQFNFENIAAETDPTEEMQDSPPTPISDLRQLEQITELSLRYDLNNSLEWSGIGGYKRTTDEEQLGEEPEAKTRTFSYENRITYRLSGKGRIVFNYKLGYGTSSGGIPFAQYTFYEGISHEIRTTADYRLRKFTDLLFRLNYRLLSTKHRKPEHRLEMTVSAEL
ncbi:hypothetical protein F4009_07595 [Candidatus Poribacteria bacterium]|nr:hypothetical protein [Candidatus Poribacteria bacterium]MYH81582.1 hypothetical protein [Candidatus Poribacteria bacterium]MYK93851.1 hypothetical protein [Candidatus Poribacteria bacterium]